MNFGEPSSLFDRSQWIRTFKLEDAIANESDPKREVRDRGRERPGKNRGGAPDDVIEGRSDEG